MIVMVIIPVILGVIVTGIRIIRTVPLHMAMPIMLRPRSNSNRNHDIRALSTTKLHTVPDSECRNGWCAVSGAPRAVIRSHKAPLGRAAQLMFQTNSLNLQPNVIAYQKCT